MARNSSAGACGVDSGAVGGKSIEWLRRALGLDQGHPPFPWQVDLLQRFLRGELVSALDIPTGLGKTATMAVWLVARALGAPLPRRLVYVVDRRAVVDQATDVAEGIQAWVKSDRSAAEALGLGDRPLPISTLRGQHVDNREWLEDPSAPAIIVGTVDMVGSRLLFSGYGVSSKMRPYHAGLLGSDTLVVLDEAHLVPAFEDLLRRVERGADVFGPKDPAIRARIPKFALLSLSATGRRTDSTPLTLTDADRRNPIVWKRLTARKSLTTIELVASPDASGLADENGNDATGDGKVNMGKAPKLANELAKQAWQLTRAGTAPLRCIVFCDARKDATAVATELRDLAESASGPEPTIELFVGARRVRERIQARDALARLGFLAGTSVNLERAAFLVATSAGEVGVDLDADHMVCDLVAWERMVQRLGRVNRRGDGDAKVVVVVEGEPAPSDGTKKAIEKHEGARAANLNFEQLTKQRKALQGERDAVLRRRRKTGNEKTVEEKRKQADKELKASLSRCQKRITAFKDADAKVVARHEAEVAKHRALRAILAAVGEGGSLGPESLLHLRQRADLAKALHDATTVEPLRPDLTRALIDAWSLTSLDEHPGRPEVGPWIRGFHPNTPPQTTLVWRRHLPVRDDGRFDAKAAKRFFEAAPPHTSEQLETETFLVIDWLIGRAAAISGAQVGEALPTAKQTVAIALTPRGEVKGGWTLEQLSSAKSKGKNESKEAKKAREQKIEQLEELLASATLVVDACLGGVTDGLLDVRANQIAEAADDPSAAWLIRADTTDVPMTGFRVRAIRNGEQDDSAAAWRTTPGNGWARRFLFVTEVVAGEPSAALAIDGWIGDAATEDERAEANRPQQLHEHQSLAEGCARIIAKRLGLDKDSEDLLALGARLHDEGKRAARWQRAFKAPVDGRPYAKTRGPIDFNILDGYRHELGSLPCVEKHDEFLQLPPDDRDLVLHLIAAHHGYARPLTGTSGCDDAPPSIVDERTRDVALRFARLSGLWGPWGLAWWETLLRAADQTASRRIQQADSPAGQKEEA